MTWIEIVGCFIIRRAKDCCTRRGPLETSIVRITPLCNSTITNRRCRTRAWVGSPVATIVAICLWTYNRRWRRVLRGVSLSITPKLIRTASIIRRTRWFQLVKTLLISFGPTKVKRIVTTPRKKISLSIRSSTRRTFRPNSRRKFLKLKSNICWKSRGLMTHQEQASTNWS